MYPGCGGRPRAHLLDLGTYFLRSPLHVVVRHPTHSSDAISSIQPKTRLQGCYTSTLCFHGRCPKGLGSAGPSQRPRLRFFNLSMCIVFNFYWLHVEVANVHCCLIALHVEFMLGWLCAWAMPHSHHCLHCLRSIHGCLASVHA